MDHTSYSFMLRAMSNWKNFLLSSFESLKQEMKKKQLAQRIALYERFFHEIQKSPPNP